MKRLERHRDPKASMWVPLSCGFLDDLEINSCSALAQLVYVRALLHAKRNGTDGLVSVRQITGGLYPHAVAGDVQQASTELVDNGLWLGTTDPDRFTIAQWVKHNGSAALALRERSGKRSGALITNHGKGQHDGDPRPDCPRCQADVSPDESAHSASAPHSGSARGTASGPLVATEVEVEEEKEKTLESSTVHPRPPDPPDDDEAQQVIDGLGIRNAVPTDGERATIALAIRRGWTVAQLETKAARALDAGEPRKYLLAALERCANTDPPAPSADGATVTPGHWNERTSDRVARLGLAADG